ncbi:hypothetical protein SIN_0384 [Streptococcus infantis SK1302]|uniref:Uncharacterized protein n=1 Tax=Streptococcus infantis SK1302 TaxID=871237 RepID=A0ABN0B6F9_9STRE|nr:hypothetical protein SIN_0384 [Streptococcus infantis SK1302]
MFTKLFFTKEQFRKQAFLSILLRNMLYYGKRKSTMFIFSKIFYKEVMSQ